MTRLKAINIFLLQWFFIRLTRCKTNSNVNGVNQTYQHYSLMYWVVPCTGWKKSFRYLNKRRDFFDITKPHLIK